MRAREFLFESDLTGEELKKEIIQSVRQETDEELLDRVHQALSHNNVKPKIVSAFTASGANSRLGNMDKVIEDMTKYVSNLPGNSRSKLEFLETLEKGNAVDVGALLSPASTFDLIFPMPFAKTFFRGIIKYGAGSKLKGPGEFALAIMSPSIKLAEKGDLEINGKNVEVKTADASLKGGRLGDPSTSPTRQAIVNNIVGNLDKLIQDEGQKQEAIDFFKSKKSIALTQFVAELHVRIKDSKHIAKIVSDVVSLTFNTSMGNAVGNAASTDSSGKTAEVEFMAQNFNWYKKNEGWTDLLTINVPGERTFNIASSDILRDYRLKGLLGSPSVSIIPSKPHELYAQIVFTKK
jgi:hypothetical protein